MQQSCLPDKVLMRVKWDTPSKILSKKPWLKGPFLPMLHLQVREEHRWGTGLEWLQQSPCLCRLDLTTYRPLFRWVIPTVPVSQSSYPWGLSFCLIFVIRKFKKGLLVATDSQLAGRNLAVYSWLMPPLKPTAASHLSLSSLAHAWMTKVFRKDHGLMQTTFQENSGPS